MREDDENSNSSGNLSEDGLSQSNNKSRAPSLSEHEKTTLFRLVSKYKLIIEAKHTTLQWIAKKQATWTTIQEEFMAQPGTSIRTPKQLKKCYENNKRKRKKDLPPEFANLKQRQMSTRLNSGRSFQHSSKELTVSADNSMISSKRDDASQGNRFPQEKNSIQEKGSSKMENEIHCKKMRLLDLQIEHEELKMRLLQEEHDLKASLLQKQISQTSEGSILLSSVDESDTKFVL